METKEFHIGFTGTRDGMTPEQVSSVRNILRTLDIEHFRDHICIHHGDCNGADAEFHEMGDKLKFLKYIHPPDKVKERAYCLGYIKMYSTKPYLDRNRDIVDVSDIMIATPKGDINVQRSGTWYTIRYALEIGKIILIVSPYGRIHDGRK